MSTEPETPPTSPQPPRRKAGDLLSALADRIGARFTTSSVFGAPVERDGVTVIPVAGFRFGLGGGSGADPAKGQDGEGGGACGMMSAKGYIELKDGGSRYVPIVQPARMVALLGLAILAALALMRPEPAPRHRRPHGRHRHRHCASCKRR